MTTVASSLTGLTVTSICHEVVATLSVSPSSGPSVASPSTVAASVAVAVTVRVKSASSSAGPVTVRLARSQPVTSVVGSVLEKVPSERVQPAGSPEISSVRVSLASVSLRLAAMSGRAMAVPSSPDAVSSAATRSRVRVGVSATASMTTSRFCGVKAVGVGVVGVLRIGRHHQGEVGIGVFGQAGDLDAGGDLGLGEGPDAAAQIGAGVEADACGDVGDLDPLGVAAAAREGDGERDVAVDAERLDDGDGVDAEIFLAVGGVGDDGGLVVDRADGDVDLP